MPLSLSEPVGFIPSCLTYSSLTPHSASSRLHRQSGVPPSISETGTPEIGRSSRYFHTCGGTAVRSFKLKSTSDRSYLISRRPSQLHVFTTVERSCFLPHSIHSKFISSTCLPDFLELVAYEFHSLVHSFIDLICVRAASLRSLRPPTSTTAENLTRLFYDHSRVQAFFHYIRSHRDNNMCLTFAYASEDDLSLIHISEPTRRTPISY